MVIMLVIL